MHARSLPNVVVQTSPKPLSSCDASSTALSRFPTLIHSAYVCVLSVELRESQAVQLETSSSKHPNKGVLLAPLISPSAASSWRPPGPCELASLLSKPTSWQPPEPGELACLLFMPTNNEFEHWGGVQNG